MSTRGSAAPSLAAPAGQHRRARPSRWRTGTLAAAGTIPVRSVNAPATLVRSEGHHPAHRRPAIPTRVYESGSGGSRHAAPVRHPPPPPPPPRAWGTTPRPLPLPAITGSREPASRAPAASLPERSAPLDPAPRSHGLAAIRAWARANTPRHPHTKPGHITPDQDKTKESTTQELQRLDKPLHMRSEATDPIYRKCAEHSPRGRGYRYIRSDRIRCGSDARRCPLLPHPNADPSVDLDKCYAPASFAHALNR